jgi:hypothetical protein
LPILLADAPRASAGDDCLSVEVGPWFVYYDSTCRKELSRGGIVIDNGRKMGVALVFAESGSVPQPGAAPSRLHFWSAETDQLDVLSLKLYVSSSEIASGTSDGPDRQALADAEQRSAVFSALSSGTLIEIGIEYGDGTRGNATLNADDFGPAYKTLLEKSNPG